MSTVTALEKFEPATTPHPVELMRVATDVAGVCREIVKKTAQRIQNKDYVRVEGWQSIAAAHGCVLGVEEVREDEHGNVFAVGVCRRAIDGTVIARAEGFVGIDETTWAKRPRYARRAMAQTRAMSRAGRSAFAFVVTLIDSNLSTTPAEEVPDGGFDDDRSFERAKPVKATAAPAKADDQLTRDEFVARVGDTPETIRLAVNWGWLMDGETFADLPADWTVKQDVLDKFMGLVTGRPAAPVTTATPDDGSNGNSVTGIIDRIAVKTGENSKGPWKRWGVQVNGEWFNTFHKSDGEFAEAFKGKSVTITYKDGERGKDILSIAEAP